MSRYIDKEWLGKHISYVILRGEREVSQIIHANRLDDAPNIDIVRCKDCKHYRLNGITYQCMSHISAVKPDDYCSYGERIEL